MAARPPWTARRVRVPVGRGTRGPSGTLPSPSGPPPGLCGDPRGCSETLARAPWRSTGPVLRPVRRRRKSPTSDPRSRRADPHTAIDPLSRVGASSGHPPWPRASWPAEAGHAGCGSTGRTGLAAARVGLDDPDKKDIAMQLVSSAENSSLDWKAQYKYIEDIGDGRGYTAGIIGFCSGTGDMLELVEAYTDRGRTTRSPSTSRRCARSTAPTRTAASARFGAWKRAAAGPGVPGRRRTTSATASTSTRRSTRPRPTASARSASSSTTTRSSCTARARTPAASAASARRLAKAKTPAQGGDETTYLNAFLDARKAAMKTEEAHSDTSRVDTAQRVFLNARQPRPEPAAEVEGLRRQLHHRLVTSPQNPGRVPGAGSGRWRLRVRRPRRTAGGRCPRLRLQAGYAPSGPEEAGRGPERSAAPPDTGQAVAVRYRPHGTLRIRTGLPLRQVRCPAPLSMGG